MSSRSLSLLGTATLLLAAACGGGLSATPSPKPAPPSSPSLHKNGAAAPSPTQNVAMPIEASGPCAKKHASSAIPIEPGRGDRVIVGKTQSGLLAYVANEDDGAIHTVDLDKHEEIAVTQLDGSPSSIVFLPDGRIGAALRDRNEVVLLEAPSAPTEPLSVLCRRAVPSEPVGLAAHASGEKLLVTSGYGHTLRVLDTASLGVLREVDLPRDPRAIAVSGNHAFISHIVSANLSVVALETGTVETIDVLSKQGFVSLVSGSKDQEELVRGSQGYSLAFNGEGRLFMPMNTVDPGRPKITHAYGGAESPFKEFVGVVDLVARKAVRMPLSPNSDSSLNCMLPRAAAARGARLFVACLGIDSLLELDGYAQRPLNTVRKRIRVPAGPMGLALTEHHALVVSQFDRALTIASVDDEAPPVYVALSRPEAGIDPIFERGRRMFHDSFEPRISADGRSCASCHPDGREDGNTWSTPDGPRQTISLAGRIQESGPYGWFGNHPTLTSHLSQTMTRLGGRGFEAQDQADLHALMTYISKMKAPVVSVNPEKAALIETGRELFHAPSQGCGECHAEGGSDRSKHDVGSGRALEARLSFDTPSLASIAGSAPYFHDGRYASLDELLAKADDRMGHAKHLKESERNALTAYMESLGPKASEERVFPRLSRPAKPIEISPDATNGVERGILAAMPPRRLLEPVAFDGNALPVVKIEPEQTWKTSLAEPQGGAEMKLLVWNGYCASVPYHAAAHLLLDWRSTGMSRLLERCVGAPDENGIRHWETMRVRTVDPLPDGRLHFEEHSGYIHLKSNKTWITQSIVADAMPIGNGLAYAFRTVCQSCKEGEQENLILISPPGDFMPEEYFSVSTLSLDKGQTGAHNATMFPVHLERWKTATKADLSPGGKVGSPLGLKFQFEVTRTASEEKPRFSVGKSNCVMGSFRCL